jgi:hypothetical protein
MFVYMGHVYVWLHRLTDCKHISVSSATRLLTDKPRRWAYVPGRVKGLSSTSVRPSLGLIQPPIQWVLVALSSGVKRPRSEGAEVKHALNYISTPPYCLQGLVGDSNIRIQGFSCLHKVWRTLFRRLDGFWRVSSSGRRYVPPKRRLLHNGLHGVISQKMILFITTAVKTSNPT